MDHDGKHIAREWDREIEDEIRNFAGVPHDRWGNIVVWAVLEAIWLVAVFAVLGLVSRLY
jgi:hypothetical protein